MRHGYTKAGERISNLEHKVPRAMKNTRKWADASISLIEQGRSPDEIIHMAPQMVQDNHARSNGYLVDEKLDSDIKRAAAGGADFKVYPCEDEGTFAQFEKPDAPLPVSYALNLENHMEENKQWLMRQVPEPLAPAPLPPPRSFWKKTRDFFLMGKYAEVEK